MKRGLLLLLMFSVFKMDKIIVCVYADGNDPVVENSDAEERRDN